VAQVVELLPSKYETLTSNPNTVKKDKKLLISVAKDVEKKETL
jgi:hypothetical protein